MQNSKPQHFSYVFQRKSLLQNTVTKKMQGSLGSNLHQIHWENMELSERESVAHRTTDQIHSFKQHNQIYIYGYDPLPRPIQSFDESPFPKFIIDHLSQLKFSKPTPIQCQAWPAIMTGRDIVGISQTGSGKTLAYILPSIVHINAQPLLEEKDGPIALILSPTRQLAMQIHQQAHTFGNVCQISSLAIYGGTGNSASKTSSISSQQRGEFKPLNRGEQVSGLKKGVEILVATPGRLIDFLQNKITNLRRVTYLVLDEADKMLNMGFAPYIQKIMSQIRPDRQLLMFSATWPQNVHKLARSYCGDKPIHINIGDPDKNLIYSVNQNIQQEFQFCDSSTTFDQKVQKMLRLLKIRSIDQQDCMIANDNLNESNGQDNQRKLLIFASTKSIVDQITDSLIKKGINAGSFHGSKEQAQRNKIIQDFKNGGLQIVVATDVASRGLDIENITCIFNFSLPGDLESYVHRIGRTGRAGKSGKAISFFTPQNLALSPQLVKLLKVAGQKVPQQLKVYQKICLKAMGVQQSSCNENGSRDVNAGKQQQPKKEEDNNKNTNQNNQNEQTKHKNQNIVWELSMNNQCINVMESLEENSDKNNKSLLNHRKLNDLFKQNPKAQILTLSKLQSKAKKKKKMNFK